MCGPSSAVWGPPLSRPAASVAGRSQVMMRSMDDNIILRLWQKTTRTAAVIQRWRRVAASRTLMSWSTTANKSVTVPPQLQYDIFFSTASLQRKKLHENLDNIHMVLRSLYICRHKVCWHCRWRIFQCPNTMAVASLVANGIMMTFYYSIFSRSLLRNVPCKIARDF